MSGIARILLARGVPVTGSDAKDSPALAALRAARRARCTSGTTPLSSGQATRSSCPRPCASPTRSWPRPASAGLRVLHRSQALAALMRGRRGVAVAGTHGKTTTTSMLTVALQHCGRRPVVRDRRGADRERARTRHDGTGDVLRGRGRRVRRVVPAVRARRSRSITNVEPDHLDHYGTAEAVEAAFDRVLPTASARRRPRRRLRATTRASGASSAAPPSGCPGAASVSGSTARARTPTCGCTTW